VFHGQSVRSRADTERRRGRGDSVPQSYLVAASGRTGLRRADGVHLAAASARRWTRRLTCCGG
jgi:hypothetical protein